MLLFEQGLIFGDAAKGLEAAVLAGFWIVARIYFGMAGEEVLGELVDIAFPIDEHLCFESVFDQGAGVSEVGKQH